MPYAFPLDGLGNGSINTSSDDEKDQNCTGNVPQNSIEQDYIAWQARSDGTSSHKLRAYVVGLKIAGVTLTFGDNIVYTDYGGAPPNTPGDAYPARGLLIGGGADLLAGYSPTGVGYLTESRPDLNTGAWHAVGYDPTGNAAVKSYAISIDLSSTDVPGWNGAGLDLGLRSVTSGAVTGTGTATGTTRYPFVVSSLGAQGVTNGSSSRYLTGLVPFSGSTDGFTVKTKDQGTRVYGPTTGYSLDILGGRWGLWRENSVLFWYGGYLYRPSGTNPQLQRSSTAAGDTPATRWAFQSFGNGTYRLRNGNPGTGTECAYKESSTNNVRVTTCGTTNQFLWRFIGEPNGIFQAQNVASGTCLDNNNVLSGSNSNLVVKSCVSGWSDTQQLILDAWNWPTP